MSYQTIGPSAPTVVYGEIKSERLTKAVEAVESEHLRGFLVGRFMWATKEDGDALAAAPLWLLGNMGVANPLWRAAPMIGEGI